MVIYSVFITKTVVTVQTFTQVNPWKLKNRDSCWNSNQT